MAEKGRPTKYNSEIVDKVCWALAESDRGLRRLVIQNPDFPSVTTIMRWLSDKDKDYFREQYALARELQADFIADQILDIADDGTNDYMTITKGKQDYNVEDREVTNRSRLRVDTRKWLLSKILPKKYGDFVKPEEDKNTIEIPSITIKYEKAE